MLAAQSLFARFLLLGRFRLDLVDRRHVVGRGGHTAVGAVTIPKQPLTL